MNGKNRIEIMNLRQLQNKLRYGKILIIDVRDQEEYQKGHIRGAKNLPYDKIEEWKDTLPENQDLVLYCDYGNLSMQAARKMPLRKGRIYTLAGGIKD